MNFFRRLLFLSLVFFIIVIAVVFLSNEVDRFSSGQLANPSVRTPDTKVTRQPVNLSPYSFAVISDIHSDIPNLQKTLVRIKSDGINFIIVAGDLTTLGKKTELQKVKTALDKGGVPYYVIPGNHDLWAITGTSDPFEEVFGAKYQIISKDSVKYILINNGDGLSGIDKRQKEWLDRELQECPKIYCLVFAHMPLNHQYLSHVMGEDTPAVSSQAANLVKQLNEFKVKELFAGHIHYLSTYELGGLKTTTDGVIWSSNAKAPPRFMEVFVSQTPVNVTEKQIWLD